MGPEQPVFSIVVPTYQRPGQLAACLQALAQLDYPRERFEVIVVDDGSKTPPEAVVTSFHDRLQVTLVSQLHAGSAAARNCGAGRARGEYLAFTDDDCLAAPDWLRTLAARFEQTPDCLIGGRTLNALAGNPYSSASQTLVDYLYGYFNTSRSELRFFTSNNIALRAERFRAIGGFSTTFPLAAGEDRELCNRWLHHGYRIIHAPEVLVHHSHRLTFRTFCRQHFNYGRGAYSFHQLYAQRTRRRIRLEPFTFYLNVLRYPYSRARGRRAFVLAALLAVSQGANAAGFYWERLTRGATSSRVRKSRQSLS